MTTDGVPVNPEDERHMQRALSLAEASVGLASPNPQVGCVLTLNGQAIGEGAHHYMARDHAEIVALKQATGNGHSTQGATAYVTLEPCSHHGRTGPCADALIAAGIARCFVATVDPNPVVSGRGIARLRAAGIEVHIGLEQARARAINNAFAWSILRGRPFVTLKAGLSVDGRLAPLPGARREGEPFWLTGPESRNEVQRLRHASDAILTGIGTVLADDPLLTDRSGLPRRKPLERIVLDPQLRTPPNAKLRRAEIPNFSPWFFCSRETPLEERIRFSAQGPGLVSVLPESKQNNLQAVLAELQQPKIMSVLLEAGPTLNGAFLRAGLVDQAIFFYAPTELGPASLPFAVDGPTSFELERQMLGVQKTSFGPDVCVSGLLHDPWASAPNID